MMMKMMVVVVVVSMLMLITEDNADNNFDDNNDKQQLDADIISSSFSLKVFAHSSHGCRKIMESCHGVKTSCQYRAQKKIPPHKKTAQSCNAC